jgi:hypothetical protein
MKRLQALLVQINPKIAEVRVENVIDNSFMNKLESSGYIQSVYKKELMRPRRAVQSTVNDSPEITSGEN